MKALFSEMQNQRLVIFSFLLTFFFSGIGVVQGLPIFITAIAYAHPIFISENNLKIRLILHHPGNHDEHEAVEAHQHHHDVLDNVIAAAKKGTFSHTDHEIKIPSSKEKLLTTTKNQVTSKSQTLLATANIAPVSVKPEVSHLGHSPPATDPSHLPLRTTLLII